MTNSSLGSSFSDQNSQNQQNLTKESNPESSLLKRQEQYQQLSQRLGESVARRIISQIARGSWNIKIALKPASLGSIDISLNLRGKEIEASFLVNQALTKELLTDSLPKLKELLEKSGINVAHVDINEKKHNKNDENSTNKKNDNYVIKDKSKEVEVDKKEQNNTNNIITSEGLNILV
tara:strand:- start:33 stop:566 length:534 start_codon:yes stop_codon:yes gene_type:complete